MEVARVRATTTWLQGVVHRNAWRGVRTFIAENGILICRGINRHAFIEVGTFT